MYQWKAKNQTNSPECKGSAAAIRAHLVRKKLPRECEWYGTDAKAKGEAEAQEEKNRQVAEGRIFSWKLKEVVETKEDHDHCQGKATSGKDNNIFLQPIV